MGSQKWKLQKVESTMIWVPLPGNLKHSNPKECTMYIKEIRLNCQGVICGILVLASFIWSSMSNLILKWTFPAKFYGLS